MDSGRVSMSQEWSRVVSAEVKEEYMTLQGIQTHCSQLTSQNPKTVKSHLSLTLMRVKLVCFDNYSLDCIEFSVVISHWAELDSVRSKPPDFSLQVYSSRSRPRQLQLPWSTSEEKPEIRELRSPGCPTETA